MTTCANCEALEQRLREATNLDDRDAEVITARRDIAQLQAALDEARNELAQLKALGRRLRRGCDCEYDHRCSNCQTILDILGEFVVVFVRIPRDTPLSYRRKR